MNVLEKREINRLRRQLQKSNLYIKDRMKVEAIVAEYFRLVSVVSKAMPSLIEAHRDAEQFVGVLAEDVGEDRQEAD